MSYIENIFILLAAPLAACLLCVRGRPKSMVAALLSGMCACLLSAYVTSFVAQIKGVDSVYAAVEIAPVVEETLKLLPILFYLVVLEPRPDDVGLAFIFVAVGFATMESGFYLASNGTAVPQVLAMRGLSSAMMHLACGIVMSFFLTRVWAHTWLRPAGTLAFLCLTMTYHGLYNVLVAAGGVAGAFAVALPLATLAALLAVRRVRR